MFNNGNHQETPCQKLGYHVGDVFRIEGPPSTHPPGSIVELLKDDGTELPFFIFRYYPEDDLKGTRCCVILSALTKLPDWREESPQVSFFREIYNFLKDKGLL